LKFSKKIISEKTPDFCSKNFAHLKTWNDIKNASGVCRLVQLLGASERRCCLTPRNRQTAGGPLASPRGAGEGRNRVEFCDQENGNKHQLTKKTV